jgi:two-component system cell cycle response regulator
MNATLPKTPAPAPAAATGARPRVLVADDSRVIRSAIKKILDADFDVVLAESGDAAWSFLARESNFQMLVTDIEMPGMDGYELICRMRGAEQAHLKDMPVLTITGAEDEQTKERAYACGATDFITKPIDAIQLKAQSARDLAEKATQLEDQAINDPLTGLRSRRFFLQRGTQDLAFCARNHKDLTVVRFDIDRYKELYRKYGDDVGDRILAWLAGIVSTSARIEDTVARVAGAKFAILASATSLDEARQLCERLRAAVGTRPFMHNGDAIELTLSFGLACSSMERAQHLEPLLALADERVQRAIIEGGNRVCVSVLGERAPQIEEVMLEASAPEAAPAEPPVEPVAELELIADATSAAVEAPLEFDVGELEIPSIAEPAAAPETPAADQVAHLISVDKALQLMASGQDRLLEPYIDSLRAQLKPLLDLIARHKG